MTNFLTKFYKGVVNSPLDFKHPNFRSIVVDTVMETFDHEFGERYLNSVKDNETFLSINRDFTEVFYGVYAFYWLDIPKGPIKICETTDLTEAISVAEEIMGNQIIDKSHDQS